MTRSSTGTDADARSAEPHGPTDTVQRRDIRNIAIIAHVDHGKTTLVDALLERCRVFRENQEVQACVLDSMDQERERGITILAKNIALQFGGAKINLIDTPGHADFGGEVERVLSMADGCLLVVDAFEGPMPQTRYVLRKAFEHRLTPLLVINKIDRPDARPLQVLDEVFDLLCDLDASDELLEFTTIYTSAKNRIARSEPDGPDQSFDLVLEAIIDKLPGPPIPGAGHGDDETGERAARTLSFQVSKIDHDPYVGRVAVGRVHAGILREGASVAVCRPDCAPSIQTIKKLNTFANLGRVPATEVRAGDIAAVIGLDRVAIGDTLCHPDHIAPRPVLQVDEPTLSMVFLVNDGPFAGREGQYVTSRHVRERLAREAEANVALRVSPASGENETEVAGRGVMHLGVLVEGMRREGYEFCVSRPRVLTRMIDGKLHEPIERLVVEVPPLLAGKVMEAVGKRRGELENQEQKGSLSVLTFLIPSRGLIGLRTRLLTQTGGEAVMVHTFHIWARWKGDIPQRARGVMISQASDPAVGYALWGLQDRGTLFVAPGDPTYEGMIVGEHCRDNDLVVNPARQKKLTNVRASGSDDAILLTPPKRFFLEEALEYIAEDELVEFTPRSIRMRKRHLTETDRRRRARQIG